MKWDTLIGSLDVVLAITAVCISAITFFIAMYMVSKGLTVTRREAEKLKVEMDKLDMMETVVRKNADGHDVAKNIH